MMACGSKIAEYRKGKVIYMVCANCGKQIEDTAKFCWSCGQPLQRPEAAVKFCTKCGTQLRSGQKFCHTCGTPVANPVHMSPQQPPHQEAPQQPQQPLRQEDVQSAQQTKLQPKRRPIAPLPTGTPIQCPECGMLAYPKQSRCLICNADLTAAHMAVPIKAAEPEPEPISMTEPTPVSEPVPETQPIPEPTPIPESASSPEYEDDSEPRTRIYLGDPFGEPTHQSEPEPTPAPTPGPEPAPEPEFVQVKEKVCPNCGTPIVEGNLFCEECGTRLNSD